MIRKDAVRRDFKYALMQAAYWILFWPAGVYITIFLSAKGYTGTELGMILAAGYTLGLVLQPVAASVADRSKSVSPTGVLAITLLLIAAIAVCFFRVHEKSLLMSGLYIVFLSLILSIQPVVNAYCFFLSRLGTPVRFGLARGVGSVCYALLSAFMGSVGADYPVDSLPVLMLVLMLPFIVVLLLMKQEGSIPRAVNPAEKPERFSLKKYPTITILLVITALMFTGHSMIDSFCVQMVEQLGGKAGDVSTLHAIMAAMELPVMLLSDRLLRRFSSRALLTFSVVCFFLKSICTALAPSVAALYCVQALHGLSFAMFVTASVRFLNDAVEPQDCNRAQSLSTQMLSVGFIVCSAAGGILVDTFGVSTALWVAAIVTSVGLLLTLIFIRNPKKEQQAA